MFRRRRRGEADLPGSDSGTAQDDPELSGDPEELGEDDDDTWARKPRRPGATGAPAPAAQGEAEIGPWDAAGSFPPSERMDFGSLLVPAVEGLDIQVNMAEDTGVWIAVVRGENALQLQAFAAPKTSGLWDEVRLEIIEEIANSGGESAGGPRPVRHRAARRGSTPAAGAIATSSWSRSASWAWTGRAGSCAG